LRKSVGEQTYGVVVLIFAFSAVLRRIDEFLVDLLNFAPLAVSKRRRLPLQGEISYSLKILYPIAQPHLTCNVELHTLVLSSSNILQNEPSEQQKKRVASLVSADKASRRLEKSKRSAVKKGRKSKGDWD
jgi:hypothetical protein